MSWSVRDWFNHDLFKKRYKRQTKHSLQLTSRNTLLEEDVHFFVQMLNLLESEHFKGLALAQLIKQAYLGSGGHGTGHLHLRVHNFCLG